MIFLGEGPLTAEQQYLTALVKAWAGSDSAPVPAPAGVSLDAIRSRLYAHNVEAAIGPFLPAATHDEAFVEHVRLSRGRTNFLLLECERVLAAIADPGWQPVLLKGAALALGTYEDPTDRWFLDLDILVPYSQVDQVCDRLVKVGYRHLKGKRDPLFYDKYHLHRIMLGPQGSVVEIHWDLTIPGSVYSHDVAGVFCRAETFRLGRTEVKCAAPVDQVLHAVYQNIADGFTDLRRILDLVLLVKRLEESDWDYLVAESQRTGMATGLYLTLHIVKQISGIEISDDFLTVLEPGPVIKRTLNGLHVANGCLDRQSAITDGYTQTLHLLLTPGVRQRIREVFRSLWVGESTLLESGYRPGQMPGLIHRTYIGLSHLKTLIALSFRAARALATG